MNPYDQELDGFDPPWEWPRTGWFSGRSDVLYEPCPFDCDLGTVVYGDSTLMECPVCAGTGIGKPHSC